MEFSNVGKQCYLCNTQDFLPIQCPICNMWYCSAHSFYQAHGCKIKQKDYIKKKEKLVKCAVCRKKMKEYRLIKCKECNKKLCLDHRYKGLHVCKKSFLVKSVNKSKKKSCILS